MWSTRDTCTVACLLFVCSTLVLFVCSTLVLFVCSTLVLFVCSTLVLFVCSTLVLFVCSTLLRFVCSTLVLLLFSVYLRKRGEEESPWTAASHWRLEQFFSYNAPFIYSRIIAWCIIRVPPILLMDRSQNYAFILHLFALHLICITFAFHLHFA